MKYSYNWLKELSGTKLSPEKLADLLTMHSFELEDIQKAGTGLENVIVAQIKAIKKHPNADRLQIAKVNLGAKTLDIVCGATNIAIGQKVPLALEGAKLLSGVEIKDTEIRGVKSKGMLCSEQDLGIGEDHEGIMILKNTAKIGENFGEYLKFNDWQIQLDVLANRGHDALSHVGMAREICVNERRKFIFLRLNLRSVLRFNLRKSLCVEIKDINLCRRYIGALIDGIEVKPSPQWMQSRLKVCGIRPINNIVDITNYVMLELGQPLHAFDSSMIKEQGSKVNIVVRRAKKGEKLKLLDASELKLSENNLLIADGKNPLALAGVMGGIGSSITDKTTNIILESANFEPVNIRKTRIEHGLSTESSYRFERDIDPNLAETAAARAIKLIMQFGGKNVNIQTLADIYPKKIKPWQIKLYVDYVNSLLGEKVPVPKIKNILENLGLGVKISKDVLNCEIPTIRLDLKTQEDLVEEIGRIYGYENIPAKLPTVELSSPVENVQRIFEDKLRDAMTTLGFSEMLNYSFYSKEDIEKCNLNIDEHFEVANPMNPDQQYMRTSLIPGILKNVKLNIKNFNKFSIFEIGHKYYEEKNNSVEKIVLDGAFVHKEIYTINTIDNEKPYFELKGKIEALFAALGFLGLEFKAAKQEKFWHPTRTSSILVDGKEVGKLGEVGPKVLASYGIKQRISVFEIGVDKLMEIGSFSQTYESINRFPSVKRDISMFVGESIKYADIEKKIAEAGGKLVLAVELFDIFEKGGEKSMALRIEIGSREKTLTSEEIDGVMKKIIEKLEKDLKVKVRK